MSVMQNKNYPFQVLMLVLSSMDIFSEAPSKIKSELLTTGSLQNAKINACAVKVLLQLLKTYRTF